MDVTKQDAELVEQRFTKRCIVLFTPDQFDALGRAAKLAGIPVGTYIRSASLALPIRQPRTIVMDRDLYGRMLGALGDAGDRLDRLLDLLEIGELPYEEDFRLARSKVETAATIAMEILERS